MVAFGGKNVFLSTLKSVFLLDFFQYLGGDNFIESAVAAVDFEAEDDRRR